MTDPVVIESPVFHVSHLVADLFGAADRYVRLFDRAVVYAGYSERHRRRAAFVLVGDVWLELVAPDGAGTRFLDRFGEHLHGLAFTVRNIDALAERLTAHGVRYGDAAGRPITAPIPRHGPALHPRQGPTTPVGGGAECEPGWWSATLYTQMDDAHGWYEFFEPKVAPNRLDPRGLPGWRPSRVAGDPVDVVGISHHTVVVAAVDEAVAVWTSALGAQLLHESEDHVLGTRSAYLRIGTGDGTVVEFAQPVGPGPAADDWESGRRDVLHRVTFLVDDLSRVRHHLDEIGCGTEVDEERLVTTDPRWCHGARYGFTTLRVPQ